MTKREIDEFMDYYLHLMCIIILRSERIHVQTGNYKLEVGCMGGINEYSFTVEHVVTTTYGKTSV